MSNTRTMTQGSGSTYEPSIAGHYAYNRLSTPMGYADISRKAGIKTKIKILKGTWLLERNPDETRMRRAFKETNHGLTAEEFAEQW